MRWFRFIFLFAACFVGGAAVAAEVKPASVQLAALAERYYEAQARFDPIYSATLQGDNRFDDQLPIGIAPGERRQRFAMYRDVLRQLARIPRGQLPAADALTHDLLAYELKSRLGFERFNDDLLPLQHLGAVPIQLATFASGQAEQPLQTVAQHEAYLRRIARLPAWIDQAMVNMREGMRRGIVQPRSVMTAVQAQLREMASDREEENPFLAPVRSLPASFADADRQRLSEAYRQEVRGRIAPAVRRLVLFIEREYLPACRDTAGWGALPEGAAWYRQWVRSQTTTELTPDEIHTMGLREVARIQKELEKVAPKLGYDGDPRLLLSWVRGNPKFLPFRSEEQILAAYAHINDRVKAKLGQLFVRSPKAALEIRPEPELTRAAASDHYSLPAEDGSRPGVFWAVINDPATYDATTMTALFLHEGQPGHHFQMAMQQEMDLPKFRKRAWINAYGEGWALYAESLGAEMGLYQDPAAYVGELRLEIFRAARLVVDTGIHAKGWSRAQAIAYLVDTAGFTEKQAANQIDRYMAWPAQALGYKLGALKIQALRERARQRLGDRFDLAAFHDTVLGEGPLPLAVLEAHVDRWIARELAKKP
ncbi:DUF885 domain-containing protein [Piscinibacter terrae]|uniref:DUF885 domain-containing protein n=1 Tax=Piscinibacter terrae TaxID=2496871 RepID=A0A3N7J517_9BURK|nr:DUF885 domain-containing protein [Albitalea terrae]RQP25922.1 DUF885 domain-containing protein [Albitalea terrae]